MVDIHCHLVPGVDDGSESVEMSLAMIEEARRAGLTAILTTPHIRGRESDLHRHEEHKASFARLLAARPTMDLYLGCEVRATSETHTVVSRPEFTASEQSKYILLELDFDSVPPYFSQLLFDYRLNGITPIVAHPERNVGVLKNPEHALEFVRHGALLQVTNGSLLGELGEAFERCALALLEAGLVSIVASDAHNVTTRRFVNWPATYELLQALEARMDIPFFHADDLCTGNPMAVCEGKPIKAVELEETDIQAIRKRLSNPVSHTSMKRKRFFFF
jgi:protein-tyrosine phosphatase